MIDKNGLILCMDIGGTNTRSAFVDCNNNVYHFQRLKSEEVFGEDSISHFVAYVEDLIQGTDVMGRQIQAICAGFPSTVDQSYRRIISTPNIKGLNDVPMAEILEDKFGIPAFINRDVSMLLYYDMHANCLPKDAIVIGCYVGTGFGNGIYINGKLLSGKNGVAGELGHIPVYGNDLICGCGNKGCIETIASGKYLFELHQEHFSDVLLKDIFEAHSNHPILQQFIKNLALPVATEINIFDPHYVILGGGVLQMNGFPKKMFCEIILEYTRKPYPACNVEFIYTVETKLNGVLGAGIFGFEQLENRSTKTAV